MTIVLTGGGSGGHITPILAVARDLKKAQPNVRLVYIGQKGDGLGDIPAQDPNIDAVYTVRAGKFRRYHNLSLFYQLLKVPTQLKNIRDGFYIVIGTVQSYILLRKLKPELVFVKGGFVGVPVGLAAARLHVPFITHDSDALPGLANRIISRWARLHAVGQPTEVYNYPAAKMVMVGVPIQEHYVPVTAELKVRYRQELKIPQDAEVLFVTGGGLGAQSINSTIIAASKKLLAAFPKLVIVHLVGRIHEDIVNKAFDAVLQSAERERVFVKGYVTDLYRYSGASDIIVTRAGATSLAEFAEQGKACVIIPNPYLTGGHQLKNAKVLQDRNAVEVVEESSLHNPEVLEAKLAQLIQDPARLQVLGRNLHQFARPDASKRLAMLLLEQSNKNT